MLGMDFRVLGTLEVWSDDARVALPSQRHQRVLAALLITPNAVVSLPRLVDALWEERPPATATKQVQNCVSALRERLGGAGGDLISTEPPGYRMTVAEDQLDSLRFHRGLATARRLAAEGRPAEAVAASRAALRLWRGPALAGLGTAPLTSRAALLDEQRLDAIEECVDWRLALGEHREVVDELAELVVEHPLRERPNGQLMLALFRGGRQADALKAFQQLRLRLADELGIDPGADLLDLHERILRGDGGLTPSAAAGRPRAPELPVRAEGAEPPRAPELPVGTGALGASGGAARRASAERPAAAGRVVPAATPEQRLDTAAEELGAAIARQWTTEAELRSLHRPEPVHVTWSSTGRPVAAVATAVLGADAHADGDPDAADNGDANRSERMALRGDLTDVVGKFRQLPCRQLAVLGEPGAGKTVLAIQLALGLLRDRAQGEPVPVLLPLASWNPDREHLYGWLARRLVEEYPGLANSAVYGRDAATRLVAEGRVFPVLDGLDETPPGLHAAAIDALDQAVADGRPLVVTCRTVEYEQAVRAAGGILARAAVVEIEPVGLDDAIAFLTARKRLGDHRWQPVVDHLRRDPGGAFAQALGTPLMVDLARTAYTHPATDPAELRDPVRFPDRRAIEEHLLAAYLPAVYAQRPPPPPASYSRAAPSPRYEPEQAGNWLAFLARHLHRAGTHELAWWQLDRAVPRLATGLLLGLPPGLLFGLAGLLAAGPWIGLVYGLSFALAGCVAHGIGSRPGPLRVELRFQGTAARFLGRFAIGVGIGVGLGLGWSLAAPVVAVLALVFGVGIGLHVWLDTPADVNRVSSPANVLRQDRVAAALFTLSLALSLGLFYGMAFAFTRQVRFVTVAGGRFDLVLALAGGCAAALMGRYLLGRTGSVAYGLAGVAVGGLVFPRSDSLAAGIAVGLVFGLAVGLAVCLSRAWGAFGLNRIWLAARGATPLQLMRFLDDAHRRGVLRQVGAVYEFRHARLQDSLAARVPEGAAETGPGRPGPDPRTPPAPGRSGTR
jgi:DNA-binding SARP family transcriptional activator